jgi:hypothetical protein
MPGIRSVGPDLRQQITKFEEMARRKLDQVPAGVSARIVTALSDRNHIVTGRMLANWNVGINAPNTSYDPNATDPGRSSMKARNLPITARAKMGDVVHITNHTPYGIYEEFGVPSGNRPGHPVVRSVAAEIPLYVRDVVAKARQSG